MPTPVMTEGMLEEVVIAFLQHNRNRAKAASALGLPITTFKDRLHRAISKGMVDPQVPTTGEVYAAQQGVAEDYDITKPVPEGLTLRGTSIQYDGEGDIKLYWNKTKPQGRNPDDAFHMPDPKRIASVSTMFDNQGRVGVQWVRETLEAKERESAWKFFAEELASDLPRVKPQEFSPIGTSSDVMPCFPVGDHHIGMLAWHEDAGDNYDIHIAEELLFRAIDYLVDASPASDQAFLPILGDFMHYDGYRPETPLHKNLLDADGRFPKMARSAVRCVRYLINAILRRNKMVTVVFEPGNHDPVATFFLNIMFSTLYENEPRVHIDQNHSNFHAIKFGKVLIGTSHGDKIKTERLPLLMATDCSKEWGETIHRYIWTGHVHHQSVKDYPGCTVESFRVLPPTDAHATSHGYRSPRDMKAIVMHKEFGEVARLTVNPNMCVPVT